MSRMFPFVTKTWNPIAGGFSVEDDVIYACPFRCSYCWARSLINKFPKGNLGKKYTGPYRIHHGRQKAITQKFNSGDFVAVQLMSDIGVIPSNVITPVFDKIRDQHETQFLLLTKSNQFYKEHMHEIPTNCVCGITMETDRKIPVNISIAPEPLKRLDDLVWLKCNYPDMKTFVSIEPIMDFTEELVEKIKKAEPWAVAVGYDNYMNKLPEPPLERTEFLIKELECFTKVYRKTIREAWNYHSLRTPTEVEQ